MAGGLDVVLTCWPTPPSKRVVVDRADVGDQSPQGDGRGLRRSGGEALVPVVQGGCTVGSRDGLGEPISGRTPQHFWHRAVWTDDKPQQERSPNQRAE